MTKLVPIRKGCKLCSVLCCSQQPQPILPTQPRTYILAANVIVKSCTKCRRQRVNDAARQLASLQARLSEQHQQHEMSSAEYSKDNASVLASVKALEQDAAELQSKLAEQR